MVASNVTLKKVVKDRNSENSEVVTVVVIKIIEVEEVVILLTENLMRMKTKCIEIVKIKKMMK